MPLPEIALRLYWTFFLTAIGQPLSYGHNGTTSEGERSGKGNLLEADLEALVNTVKCDGFLGKGVALQFTKAFPDNFKAYQRAWRAGELVPGQMFVFDNRILVHPAL